MVQRVRHATDRWPPATQSSRVMPSANVITCAAAGRAAGACSTSRSPRSSTRWSGASTLSGRVARTGHDAGRLDLLLIAGLARLRVALGFVLGALVLILAHPTLRSI